MALIKCSNCGMDVSDTTKKCIHCGKKIKKLKTKKEKQRKIEHHDFNKDTVKKEVVKDKKTKANNKVNKKLKLILLGIILILFLSVILFLILLKINNDKFVTVDFKYDKFDKVMKIEKGDTIQYLKVENKKGYVFTGWYLKHKKYNFNKKVTSNITLSGKWLKEYIVEFNSDGGSNIDSQKVTKNNKITKPKNPTKEGYDFINWYLDDKEYKFDSKVKSNIKLVAKWKEQEKANNETVYENNINQSKANSNITNKSACKFVYRAYSGNLVVTNSSDVYNIKINDYFVINSFLMAGDESVGGQLSNRITNTSVLEKTFEAYDTSFRAIGVGQSNIIMTYSGCINGTKTITVNVSE